MTKSDDLIHDPNGGMPRLLEIMRRLRDPPETGCPLGYRTEFFHHRTLYDRGGL